MRLLRLVPVTPDESAALANMQHDAPVSIPWSAATLCADCEHVHNKPGHACPSCTSEHGILLSRLLGSMSEEDHARDLASVGMPTGGAA